MNKLLSLLGLTLLFGCKEFPEADFQEVKCGKQAPSGKISTESKGNLRYEFSLSGINTKTEQFPIRIIWTIEGKTYTGSRISYQFAKKGLQPVSVVFYNACLMEATDKINDFNVQ